jgi:hypothetical protein
MSAALYAAQVKSVPGTYDKKLIKIVRQLGVNFQCMYLYVGIEVLW